MEKTWAVNNSMAHEATSMQDVTLQVIQILDANYEKADLKSIVSTNCTHLSPRLKNVTGIANRI